VLEKRGILGDSKKPGRRPGDVTFPCWQDSKGLAVDVCVTSPFSTKNAHSESPADDFGLRKHKKYDKGFEGKNFRFCALALETTGGVSEEGLSFLRQLWRFAARQQNTKLCVYAGRAWARLSCNLQTSVAQAILHRIPTGGNPPPKPTPIEVSVVTVDNPVVEPPSLASLPHKSGPAWSPLIREALAKRGLLDSGFQEGLSSSLSRSPPSLSVSSSSSLSSLSAFSSSFTPLPIPRLTQG